ncbi:late competence development ComFB family protein [Motiliproteus sediminis]|uniref:late competence development ComFB family protein n=1 Tax=Motiliproteus sediminis TaxID=1468178 RepID=UPI001AEF796C|nr:late competence development ComFB family protein [Motiliproteus sediminis]
MSIGENIHNYYEKMVNDELSQRFLEGNADVDYLADVACVALNHLPPRYFRHEIDMAFYLSPLEFEEMRTKVKAAVDDAIEYVDRSHREMEQPAGASKAEPVPESDALEQ